MKRYPVFVLILFVFLSSCSFNKETNYAMGETWSFIVFSDIQQGFGVYGALARQMARIEPGPDAAFCCGDIMLRPANEAEWESFHRYSLPITQNFPLRMARGNHEGNDPVSELVLRQQMEFPPEQFYYTYRTRDVLLIILDTEIAGQENSISGQQLAWLKQKLGDAEKDCCTNHVFVLMHRPLFPRGKYANTLMKQAEELHQMFLQYSKIRAVFNGHEHLFNHYIRDGLHYITTGGGGGVLTHGYGGNYNHFTKVSFYHDPFRINIKTIGIFHEVVDDFDLPAGR
ncbi:MAG TPA: metallophosphoesterase [Bacteroidales bacterium]|nr:metallophosphoesterase [Bacteroidales bacterium]HSA43034.1 metallophosphoesterase [Bacteroidales bacterium]